MEWVQRTIQLGAYLVGDEHRYCAHVRYRPKDMLSSVCRQQLAHASESRKFEVYSEICRKFRPVFHHFFLE